MNNKDLLIRTLIIYIISMILLCKLKPMCIYNPNMTYKPWYQYMITNDIGDIVTITSLTVFLAIFSILLANNV